MKGYGNYPSIFHCMTVNYNRFYFESRDREWFSLPSGLTTRSAESLAACDNCLFTKFFVLLACRTPELSKLFDST